MLAAELEQDAYQRLQDAIERKRIADAEVERLHGEWLAARRKRDWERHKA